MSASGNAVLIDALASSLRRGGNALEDVPGLLEKVIDEESWREFVTQRGELVQHDRFSDFVREKPLRGLGASDELIDRIVGTKAANAEVRRKLRETRKGSGGRPRADEKSLDSNGVEQGEDSGYTADRLARNAPDEYEAVKRGEKTINAAAVAAGIRPHRISVRLDRPESIARSLRQHMKPDDVVTLARLLQEG